MRTEAFDDFGWGWGGCCEEGTDPDESSDFGAALGWCGGTAGSELGGGEGAAERSLVLLVPVVDSLGAGLADGGEG